jgi:predicted ATPase
MAAIEQAFMLSERHEERWCLPELLRNKVELRLFKGSRDSLRSAEECLRQALNCAGRDGTLAWELRAAISLTRLRRDQGQQAGTRDLLASVYDPFTEGFGTADLREAKRLIDALS